MKKVRNRFLMFAMIAVTVLLSAVLVLINLLNYSMVTEDADMVTKMISSEGGAFGKNGSEANQDPARRNPMGPDSPETAKSVRYFTVSFNQEGGAEIVSMKLSALSEDEAVEMAKNLLENGNKTRVCKKCGAEI